MSLNPFKSFKTISINYWKFMAHRAFEFPRNLKLSMIFSNRKNESTYKILRNSYKTVKRNITVKSKN